MLVTACSGWRVELWLKVWWFLDTPTSRCGRSLKLLNSEAILELRVFLEIRGVAGEWSSSTSAMSSNSSTSSLWAVQAQGHGVCGVNALPPGRLQRAVSERRRLHFEIYFGYTSWSTLSTSLRIPSLCGECSSRKSTASLGHEDGEGHAQVQLLLGGARDFLV